MSRKVSRLTLEAIFGFTNKLEVRDYTSLIIYCVEGIPNPELRFLILIYRDRSGQSCKVLLKISI